MRTDIEVGFNPFYDSQFYISVADKHPESRLPVELYENELLRLRNEIDCVLKHNGWHKKN